MKTFSSYQKDFQFEKKKFFFFSLMKSFSDISVSDQEKDNG
jgi:hypothetical protein